MFFGMYRVTKLGGRISKQPVKLSARHIAIVWDHEKYFFVYMGVEYAKQLRAVLPPLGPSLEVRS